MYDLLVNRCDCWLISEYAHGFFHFFYSRTIQYLRCTMYMIQVNYYYKWRHRYAPSQTFNNSSKFSRCDLIIDSDIELHVCECNVRMAKIEPKRMFFSFRLLNFRFVMTTSGITYKCNVNKTKSTTTHTACMYLWCCSIADSCILNTHRERDTNTNMQVNEKKRKNKHSKWPSTDQQSSSQFLLLFAGDTF